MSLLSLALLLTLVLQGLVCDAATTGTRLCVGRAPSRLCISGGRDCAEPL